jgi:NMD protein affecting ribosome stability and mRNA decay
LKLEKAAILTCSTCGIEGKHELLYLSERLEASRCSSCGKTQVYSKRIYSEYARDMVRRTLHLPGKLTGEVLENPVTVASWPVKAIRKPFRLLAEVSQVAFLERSRRSGPGSNRSRPSPSAARC